MSIATPRLNWSESSASRFGFEMIVVVTWNVRLQRPAVNVPPIDAQVCGSLRTGSAENAGSALMTSSDGARKP